MACKGINSVPRVHITNIEVPRAKKHYKSVGSSRLIPGWGDRKVLCTDQSSYLIRVMSVEMGSSGPICSEIVNHSVQIKLVV